MNCKNCGAPLVPEDRFCKSCGTPVESVVTQPVQQQPAPSVQPAVAPVTNVQPMMNQPMPQAAPSAMAAAPTMAVNNTQKKDNSKTILIVLLLVVAVIGAVLIVLLLTKNNNAQEPTGNDPIVNTGTDAPEVTPTKVSSYKVNYENFTFDVPDNLIYYFDEGTLIIGDSNSTWEASILINEGMFENLKTNKAYIQGLLAASGFTSGAAEIKTYGGLEYVTAEVGFAGENYLLACAKLNSMNYAFMLVATVDNTYDYNLLETIAPILSNSSYQGFTTSLKAKPNVDFSSIFDLAKEAENVTIEETPTDIQ